RSSDLSASVKSRKWPTSNSTVAMKNLRSIEGAREVGSRTVAARAAGNVMLPFVAAAGGALAPYQRGRHISGAISAGRELVRAVRRRVLGYTDGPYHPAAHHVQDPATDRQGRTRTPGAGAQFHRGDSRRAARRPHGRHHGR